MMGMLFQSSVVNVSVLTIWIVSSLGDISITNLEATKDGLY